VLQPLVACVGENRADWWVKMENLVLSVRRFGGALADAPVVVHMVGAADPATRSRLEGLGAEVLVVEPVDRRLPSSNKFRMFELAEARSFDVLVALDCDLVVMGDISTHLSDRTIRAVPAGQSHLDDDGWARLYQARGLAVPPRSHVTTVTGERSRPYFNSGVMFVPRDACGPLRHAWEGHLRWLLDGGADELGLGRLRRDQIPLSLALASTGATVDRLPLNLNLSTVQGRYARAYRDETGPPWIYHYHRSIDTEGFLTATLHRDVNARFDEFNRVRADALGLRYAGMAPMPLDRRVRAWVRAQPWYRSPRRRFDAWRKARH
jgi:hypothetical protein